MIDILRLVIDYSNYSFAQLLLRQKTPRRTPCGELGRCECAQLRLTLLLQLFKLLLFQIELIGEARRRIQGGVGLVEVHLTESREPLKYTFNYYGFDTAVSERYIGI